MLYIPTRNNLDLRCRSMRLHEKLCLYIEYVTSLKCEISTARRPKSNVQLTAKYSSLIKMTHRAYPLILNSGN
jgi:hypothetical protein